MRQGGLGHEKIHTYHLIRKIDMDDLLIGSIVKKMQPVEDYWQILTDGPIVTINNPFEITLLGKHMPMETATKVMVGQRIVAENYLEDDYYLIILENGLQINISLNPMDYVCPEAVYIANSNSGQFVVF